MIRTAVFAAFALLAQGAVAQDVTAQYAVAQRLFIWPGVSDSTDPQAYIAAAPALIESLAGSWVAVDQLALGSGRYDAALLPDHCAPLHFAITPTSDFSFDMTTTPRDPARARLTMRFDYAGFNQFSRSRDTQAFLDRLGVAEMGADIPPGVFLGGDVGRVSLFHPSAGILILQGERGRPEIYARCPG